MPIPRSSIGECEPDVTSPPSSMAMPCRGIPGSCMTKATSFRAGPSLLDPAQLLDPGEVRVERADPAEAGRDRVRVRADVVAVQRVADLEAQRVPRAEPARLRSALDHRVPESRRVLGHDHQLDALLARVARAVDHHLDPVDLAHRERERRGLVEPEPLERARPLHGEQRELVGDLSRRSVPAPLALLRSTRSRPRGSTRSRSGGSGRPRPGRRSGRRRSRRCSFVSSVYCAPPTSTLSMSFESSDCSSSRACGPSNSISPMCETSKTPQSSRTALCSGMTPSYCTGISQPANGTMRAPSATWRS